MKLDIAANFAGAATIGIGGYIGQFGTTPEILSLAMAGAVLAAVEMEIRTLGRVTVLFVFNAVVGALGAPWLVYWFDLSHPAAVFVVAFLAGYAAHDVAREVRAFLPRWLSARLGGKK